MLFSDADGDVAQWFPVSVLRHLLREPLDKKIEILRRIPNLRKISASYWNNAERLVEKVGSDLVLSHKPTPALFARDDWHPDMARKELRNFLKRAGSNSHVELIMKDISTVSYQPRRLWEWSAIALEVAEEFAR